MPESSSTCTHCGCVCDDLTFVVADGRLTHAENACELALRRFASAEPDDGAIAFIDGQPAALNDAVARAAHLLQEARRPLVYGCVETTVEAQSAAVKLAQQLGGVFDSPALPEPSLFPGIGTVTCSLSEAKNRADLIVLWNCDPERTHPRLLSRYLLEPAGKFRPDGHRGRSLERVVLPPGTDFEALWSMRERARGRSTGEPRSPLDSLVDRLRAARFGVIAIDESAGPRVIEAAHGLATDLQSGTRCYVLELRGGGNPVGVQQVVTWLGAPTTCEVSDFDVILSVGPPPAGAKRGKSPQIHLTPRTTPATQSAAVAIRTAPFPLAQAGTVLRMDGVALPIRAVLPSSAPSEFAVLNQIARSLRPADR